MSESEVDRKRRLNRENKQRYRRKHPNKNREAVARYQEKKLNEEYDMAHDNLCSNLQGLFKRILCMIESLDMEDPDFNDKFDNLMMKLVAYVKLFEIRFKSISDHDRLVKLVKGFSQYTEINNGSTNIKYFD